jgi:hypothetical protein
MVSVYIVFARYAILWWSNKSLVFHMSLDFVNATSISVSGCSKSDKTAGCILLFNFLYLLQEKTGVQLSPPVFVLHILF